MDNTAEAEANSALINSFSEITSASKEEALFFLESHQWNLDSAVSTFLDNTTATASAAATTIADNNNINNRIVNSGEDRRRRRRRRVSVSNSSSSESLSPNYSPSPSPSPSPSRSRSRSRSPPPAASSPAPYRLRSRGKRPAATSSARNKTTRDGVRTLAHLNEAPEASDDDKDDADYQPEQEYYTGGEKSGMLVQDPQRHYDADAIFDQARQSVGVERVVDNLQSSSSSRSFTGTGRLLSEETVPSASQPPETVNHNVTLWRNGFTVDNGPLRGFDDPSNASFLESIKKSECPLELQPADRRTQVHLELARREENYSEPKKPKASFQGVGRTLGSSGDTAASDPTSPSSLKTAPLPSIGLVIDFSLPTTSIQLRLADGTRMVSRFNLHHTIRDIRSFIEASRPGGGRDYQLQTVGFPPKQLTDPDQTIDAAGIANSVVIQKF